MKNKTILTLILLVLLVVFLGCVECPDTFIDQTEFYHNYDRNSVTDLQQAYSSFIYIQSLPDRIGIGSIEIKIENIKLTEIYATQQVDETKYEDKKLEAWVLNDNFALDSEGRIYRKRGCI